MKDQQMRVDPSDGKANTLDSFLKFYGKDEGQHRWTTAGQQPAYTGITLGMCRGMALRAYESIFLPACSSSTGTLLFLFHLHSLLASLRSCRAFHVALLV